MALTQVKSDGIATGAVTADQIAVNAVTVDDISDGSISTAKLADDSVNGDKLANTAVTAGTYGSSSAIPSITVDAQGRITSASTSSIDSTAITNGTSNVSVAASGDITASRAGTTRLTVNSTGAAVVGDLEVDGTGYVGLPAGTTAQRPGSPSAGYFRYNTTTGSPEFYTGTTWIATNLIPSIDSATGTIYAGAATNLTLGVSNATATVDVVFKEGATTLATVANQTVSSGSVTVAVPSAVYGQTAGDTITIQVANEDGTPSLNSASKTVTALPTGGTVTSSGGYRYHTFTSSGTFVASADITADYLVVAGGAGGSGFGGGGGGAGGYIARSSQSVSASSYTITIGAGGTSPNSSPYLASNGSDSSAFGQTAVGGGRGANDTTSTGSSGGSGGGAGTYGTPPSTGGSGTTGQGNDGGDSSDLEYAAGGGGAGAAGTDGTSGGHGGNGSTWLNGTTYAGGGGGGMRASAGTSGGNGGSGGGGRGADSSSNNCSAGSANTGGGGGGGRGYGATDPGTSGGSGIVIIRFQL